MAEMSEWHFQLQPRNQRLLTVLLAGCALGGQRDIRVLIKKISTAVKSKASDYCWATYYMHVYYDNG